MAKGRRGLRLAAAFVLAAAVTALAGAAGAARAENYPPLFTSVAKAQQHCPSDVVVWIDPTIGVYRFKGQKSYAKTNRGAYACKGDAIRSGAHPAVTAGGTSQ